MNDGRNVKIVIAASLLALSVAVLLRGDEKKTDSLTGTWDCMAHVSGESDIPFTMRLELKSGIVTGSVATHAGDLEVKSGTYKDGKLELHLEMSEAKYVVTGKLEGDEFKGQWSKDPDGTGGDWEGKKSATARPPSQ